MYSYKKEDSKKAARRSFGIKKFLAVGLPLLGIIAGGYILLMVLTPQLNIATYTPPDSSILERIYPEGNYLEIKKLDLIVPIGMSVDALEYGSWMRYADQRNPEIGGNVVLTGHRFRMGFTPREIANSSPFYNINLLGVGDTFSIHYNGETYEYKIEKKHNVKPTAIEIEENSLEHKVTLYTCTLGGAADGRVVIEAGPV